MKLNETLKAMCAKTGAQEAWIEKPLNYYIEGCGWTEERAQQYICGLFADGTIDAIVAFGGKKPQMENMSKKEAQYFKKLLFREILCAQYFIMRLTNSTDRIILQITIS